MHAALRTLRGGRASWGRRPTPGGVLLAAVPAVGLGVAFAGGGYGPTASAVAVSLVALLGIVVGAMCAGGLVRMLPHRDAAVGTLLLIAFGLWALASTSWSIRPDRSLAWGALATAYGLSVFVAGSAARLTPRARAVAVGALLLGCVALGGAALLGRLSPDPAVTIGGVRNATRLRGPLDYWNALGLLGAIGVVVAARQAVDTGRAGFLRVVCGAAVPPLLAVVVLSQSRGALVALAIGLLVTAWASGAARLRLPAFVVASGVAAVPLAVTAAGRVEGETVVAADGRAAVLGALVAAILLGGLLALVAREVERRVAWPAARTRVVVRRGAAALGVALVLGALAFTVDRGGPGPALTDLRDRVAASDEVAPVAGADRLLSVSASNRTGWWAEAVGAWADRPVQGWGAGSFGTIRRRYRQDTTEVTQPHSLPLQVLSETGVVGLALLGGALWLLLRVAVRRLRRMREDAIDPRQLALQATLLGTTAAWLAQSAVDWHFDLPGVTIPVLAGLAVAAAAPAPRRSPVAADGTIAPATIPELERQLERQEAHGPGGAGVLVLTLVGGLCLVVLVVAPVVGDRLADRARDVLAGDASPAALRDATGDAVLAASLDPLGLDPLEVAREINLRRGDLLEARRLALRETERQPENPDAWIRLADTAGVLADRPGMRVAARRAVALDPFGVSALSQLADAVGRRAPPEASPTATATPLPAVPGTGAGAFGSGGSGGAAGVGGAAGTGGVAGTGGAGGRSGSAPGDGDADRGTSGADGSGGAAGGAGAAGGGSAGGGASGGGSGRGGSGAGGGTAGGGAAGSGTADGGPAGGGAAGDGKGITVGPGGITVPRIP